MEPSLANRYISPPQSRNVASMIPLSVLDLSPIIEGGDASQAFRNSLQLAQHAERLDFQRFWLAEHHNVQSVATSAPSVIIAYVAAGTSKIRVGAGGIMLPNHAPFMVAEQFGSLEALFPGRIDLGVGRSPGANAVATRALRRSLSGGDKDFARDVIELMTYFQPASHGQALRAVPGAGLDVPIWILGSSLFSAQLAAALGLPYAFGAHVAPAGMDQAIALYRAQFQASPHLDRPYAMVALNVFAADTDAEAWFLASSFQQIFINQRSGRPGQLPAPIEKLDVLLDPTDKALLNRLLASAVIGSIETVRRDLKKIIERTAADELIVTAQIFDHRARLKSFELTAQAHAANSSIL